MKIAFLSFGFAESCIPLVNKLAQQAHVLLLVPDQALEPYLTRVGTKVLLQSDPAFRRRALIRNFQTMWALVKRIRVFAPDVIHIQQGHFWFTPALFFLGKVPLVVTVHDPRHHIGDKPSLQTPQQMMDFGFRRAKQLIAHSEFSKRVLVQELGLPPERVQVIPLSLFDPEIPFEVSNEIPDTPRILFFGRIWEYKGLQYLIQAEPYITAQLPNAKIVIAGRGENLARYRAMMRHPENFIVHNDHIPEQERTRLFAHANVVVLPYIEATQSGVIPLACAFAKPVVVTRVGALPEVVEDGVTGYVVPPRDPRALADKIVHLLANESQRRAMGANARRKFEQEFSATRAAEQTLAVYERAMRR